MAEFVDIKAPPPHRRISRPRRSCGIYTYIHTHFASIYSCVELSSIFSMSTDMIINSFSFLFVIFRWNDDEDDDTTDQKSDIVKRSEYTEREYLS